MVRRPSSTNHQGPNVLRRSKISRLLDPQPFRRQVDRARIHYEVLLGQSALDRLQRKAKLRQLRFLNINVDALRLDSPEFNA